MLIGIDASRANMHYKTGPQWYAYYLIRKFAQLDSQNEYLLYVNEPVRGGLLDLCEEGESAYGRIEIDSKGYQKIKSPHGNFKAKILRWPFHFFWTQGRLSLEMALARPDALFIPAHAIPVIHPKRTYNTIHDIGFEVDRKFFKNEILGPENMPGRMLVDRLVRICTFGKYGATSGDYLSWSSRYSVAHSKKVIVPSEFTKNELVKTYKADPSRIITIRNGYNSELYRRIEDNRAIDRVLAKYGITRPYILYVGRLEWKKNTHSLVQAYGFMLQKHKDIPHHLVMIGNASFGYDEVNYMMHEYRLEDRIHMPGWIDEREMPSLYSGASAFIYPSLYEGFGIPVLQAMACEIPVGASNIESIIEVAGDAALLFDPLDLGSISDAVYKLISDRKFSRSLAARGRARADSFGWEKCARETLEVITAS